MNIGKKLAVATGLLVGTFAYANQNSAEAQDLKTTPTSYVANKNPVKVIDDFLGKGHDVADYYAQKFSLDKQALILFLTTDGTTQLQDELEKHMSALKHTGRNRIAIFLGDKPRGTRNQFTVYALGKYQETFYENGNGLGNSYKFVNYISTLYDAEIEPKLGSNYNYD